MSALRHTDGATDNKFICYLQAMQYTLTVTALSSPTLINTFDIDVCTHLKQESRGL